MSAGSRADSGPKDRIQRKRGIRAMNIQDDLCVVIETAKPQEAGKRLGAYAAALAGGMKACTEQKALDESSSEKAEEDK